MIASLGKRPRHSCVGSISQFNTAAPASLNIAQDSFEVIASFSQKPYRRSFHNTMSSAATEKNNETIELARTLAHVPLCEEYERMISGML